jgi:hypothetical protein
LRERRCRCLTARLSGLCERGSRIPRAITVLGCTGVCVEQPKGTRVPQCQWPGPGGADWNLTPVRGLLGDGPGSLPVLGSSRRPGPSKGTGVADGKPAERSSGAGSVPPPAGTGPTALFSWRAQERPRDTLAHARAAFASHQIHEQIHLPCSS